MPSLRLHPLLLAGAACLTLAACGSDDDPPASQADAPATTESAAPTTTPSGNDGSTSAPAASTTEAPSASDEDEPRASNGKGSGAKTGRSSTPSNTPQGSPASAAVTAAVRETLVSLQEAFAAKDGKKACSLMYGIPEKSDPKKPGLSCELLSRGRPGQVSTVNRRLAATAKVTVDGNRAFAELRPGVPLRLRKVDGRWLADYSQTGQGASGSR